MCLSVCEDISGTTRAIFTIFVHIAYVRGSVLFRHVDDRPHRLSAGKGDGSAQRGRNVIYDCLVYVCHQHYDEIHARTKQATINKYSLFYWISFGGYWPSMLAGPYVVGLKAGAGGPIHS